jgi:phytoene dehydrogenase-like protein
MTSPMRDVVTAGLNGLTAAAVLSLAGLSVTLLEARETIGGGCRTASLTLPGFHHDVRGAIHPMGVVSPILQRLQLTTHGVQWMSAAAPLAHPFDNGRVAILSRDLADMAHHDPVSARHHAGRAPGAQSQHDRR